MSKVSRRKNKWWYFFGDSLTPSIVALVILIYPINYFLLFLNVWLFKNLLFVSHLTLFIYMSYLLSSNERLRWLSYKFYKIKLSLMQWLRVRWSYIKKTRFKNKILK